MKKLVPILIFTFLFPISTGASYFWDNPSYLLRSSEESVYSDIRIVDTGELFLLFVIKRGENSASLLAYHTEDMQRFLGPRTVLDGIQVREGFYPHYDLLFSGGVLYLAWNDIAGNIHFLSSTDQGVSWKPDQLVVQPGDYSFDPSLFFADDYLVLLYHTESEGRKIDFYYILSRDGGKTWSPPYRPAGEFAGSFFPFLSFYRGTYYVVWQSRPFSKTRTPVFDIYLSTTDALENPWSEAVNLTDDFNGDDVQPQMIFEGGRFSLLWESDREGTWGVYYCLFSLQGQKLGKQRKVNSSLAGARSAQPLAVGEELYIFYIDERDGIGRLYYAKRRGEGFEEFGPVSTVDTGILHHTPIQKDNELYQIWQDRSGIAYTGPDRSVRPIKFLSLINNYIGIDGITLRWIPPSDSSGLAGYCYAFTRERSTELEIVNLSSSINSLKLNVGEEGVWYLHLRAKDNAGNLSSTTTLSFTADLEPPAPPVLSKITVDENGFYSDNSPLFEWSSEDPDITGYSYSFSRTRVDIESSRILTTENRMQYQSVEGGDWFFNIAAVDQAGNISETVHTQVQFKPLPPSAKGGDAVPPFKVEGHRLRRPVILKLLLYVFLGGVLFTICYFTAKLLKWYRAEKEEVPMKRIVLKKRKFGLRFKFSILIGVLVLLLTVGISGMLSWVSINHEKRALANQMIAQAKLSLENMTNVAREGILNNDELLLLSLIDKTMENEDIRYSFVLDINNQVIAHSDIDQKGDIYTDEFTQRGSHSETVVIEPKFRPDALVPLYDLASPVRFAGNRIGTVRLGFSTDSIFRTIDEVRRTNVINTIIITIITIIVGVAGAIVMATVTIRPIKTLAVGANIIGGGNLDYKIRVHARDEIGSLADEFNRMTQRLRAYQREMEKKAKLDEQLDIARRIQQSMIPTEGIETNRLSIDGYYRAAAGVGGDYYDFIEIGDGLYGLIMSDVSGKGVPASLMMIMIRMIFKSLVHSGVYEPARVVTLMNSTLASDISSDRFATLLFGVFDLKKRTFRFANAGYGPLMVYRADASACAKIGPSTDSIPIGVLPEIAYSEEVPVKLNSGDALVLFTDGIHEARNAKKQEYGMERLATLIPRYADMGSRDIANSIVDDVLRFVGKSEQHDDITLLIMKVR